MKVLDLNLPTAAENLACDEALLEIAETGQGGEVLRFWESPQYFVVVGYANKVDTEVDVAACAARGIPILRRCSGGGTVVQGPGCLNYALVLRITADPPTQSISAANRFIMERNRTAVEWALRSSRPEGDQIASPTSQAKSQSSLTSASTNRVEVCGHTDLAIGGLKFSGNSQRRRKNFLLFHGTLLLDFDLELVGRLLRMPTHEPDYRAGRPHQQFITNLHLKAQEAKRALGEAWKALGQPVHVPAKEIEKLVAEKYSQAEWNRKF